MSESKSNNNKSTFLNELVIAYIVKVIRVIFQWISLIVAKNHMIKIYEEKVLLRQENPPHLLNLIALFLVIHILFEALLIFGVYIIANIVAKKKKVSFNPQSVLLQLGFDYIAATAILILFGGVVGQIMYKKKYFLYKENGHRAIRALKDILLMYAIAVALLPFNLVPKAFEKNN